jgi:hypothetical protein
LTALCNIFWHRSRYLPELVDFSVDKEIKMSKRTSNFMGVSGSRRAAWGSLMVLVALLALTACGGERIRIPRTDTSPPTVELQVSGAGPIFTLTERSADVSRTLVSSSRVTMIVVGRDTNGGVSDVVISGEVNVDCKAGTDIHETIREDNPQGGGVGGMGTTVLSTAYVLNVGRWAAMCQNGSVVSMSGFFTGGARNYHMGSATTSEFQFTYP